MGGGLSKVECACCCGGKRPELRFPPLDITQSPRGPPVRQPWAPVVAIVEPIPATIAIPEPIPAAVAVPEPIPEPVAIPEPMPAKVEPLWRNLFPESSHKGSISIRKGSISSSISSRKLLETGEDEVELDCSSEEEDVAAEDSEKVIPDDSKRARSGTDMMRDRLTKHASIGITADELAKTPTMIASVAQIANGKWRIHGLHVEKMVNAGLQRLDRMLATTGISNLPIGPNGRSPLLRESLIQGLIDGTRDLKAVAPNDTSAAQKDLPHLSLRQLLRLRVSNLDFAVGGNSTHAAFLMTAEALIFQRIGQKAAECDDIEKASAKKLGRELVLLVAAAKVLPMPPCWVCWFEGRRIFFHVNRLACTECAELAFGEGGVLEFVDRSEPDKMTGGTRLMLQMPVNLCEHEDALKNEPVPLNAPSMSTSSIQNALGALKKVNSVPQ